jgi:hypothetical protein
MDSIWLFYWLCNALGFLIALGIKVYGPVAADKARGPGLSHTGHKGEVEMMIHFRGRGTGQRIHKKSFQLQHWVSERVPRSASKCWKMVIEARDAGEYVPPKSPTLWT